MQKILAGAQTLDRRHRGLLQWLLAAALVGAFMLGSALFGPKSLLAFCNGWPEKKIFIVMLGALLFAALGACLLVRRWSWEQFGFMAALMLVAMLIRAAVFNQITADYVAHLSQWVDTFREHGFAALAMDVGDYNLPYQYLIALIAKLPLNPLYMIKYTSIIFDFALAILMMRLVERFLNKKYAMLTLAAVLLIPTLWFNGAFWAQCDALYCFFVMACLYAMLADRPVLSVAMLTVAFSFKIQTVFFFPLVLLALWGKKYKLRHALVFPLVYLLLMTPALFAGRSLGSALTIYLRQAGQYNDRLTRNAANIYQFMPFGELANQPAYTPILKFIPGINGEQWNEWYTLETISYLQGALVPYAGMLVLCLIYYLYNHRKYIGMEQVWRFSLAFTLLMPLILPKMHDRYFVLAEVFAILYAVRYPKRWFIPVLVIFASFESYMPFLARERPLDMRMAAAMMIAAMGVVLADIVRELRAAKAADPARLAEQN